MYLLPYLYTQQFLIIIKSFLYAHKQILPVFTTHFNIS